MAGQLYTAQEETALQQFPVGSWVKIADTCNSPYRGTTAKIGVPPRNLSEYPKSATTSTMGANPAILLWVVSENSRKPGDWVFLSCLSKV